MSQLVCPIPLSEYPRVLLAHGGGGKLMHRLIEHMFLATFDNPELREQGDSAVLNISAGQLAFSTDASVVSPIFFPGGDIGSLAVHGCVNDLAVAGARPRYLSMSFILEEGLCMQQLWEIVQSIQRAARQAEVSIVTGDTKVVPKGQADLIYISTSGIGVIEYEPRPSAKRIQVDDAIIISADIGRHAIALMTSREGIEFESTVESDSTILFPLIESLRDSGVTIHCMRDLTRGGLTSAAVELAQSSGQSFLIDEQKIPVLDQVQAACELFGFDALSLANEGCFILFVPQSDAHIALQVLRQHHAGKTAQLIGSVLSEARSRVQLQTASGSRRLLDMLSAEQLPRIC